MDGLARRWWRPVCAALLGTLLWGAVGMAAGDDLATAPPEGPYRKVSSLVPLPDFIPGMGTLYVDPATLPVGPFLGYDRNGTLVQVTFMVPLKDLDAHKNWHGLADVANWVPVDHVDIMYNPGHPGVPEPHYHFTLWLISHEEEQARMK